MSTAYTTTWRAEGHVYSNIRLWRAEGHVYSNIRLGNVDITFDSAAGARAVAAACLRAADEIDAMNTGTSAPEATP